MKKKIFYIVLTMIVSSAVVVEKMGWREHLWFNGVVCLINIICIVLSNHFNFCLDTKVTKNQDSIF